MMFRLSDTHTPAWIGQSASTPLVLIAANLFFNVVANVSFKLSAFNPAWRGFLAWQVVGNLAGLVTVLTLTALLRFLPLHVAYPVTTGLAILGVQVAAGGLIFHEAISFNQWVGVGLIILGIGLVGGR